VRHFNEERENVHDDPWSGQPSVVNEDLVRAMEEKIQESRQFTISSLSLHFPQISWSLLHEIVSEKLCASIATHLRNCVVQSSISNMPCLVGVL
jgi:hypothetical protein